MAKNKPKQAEKKPAEKTQSAKVATVATPDTNTNVWKGFFSRKYGEGENIRTIFKTPKIWGALIGELLGTMLLTMLFLTTIGVFRADLVPLLVMFAAVCIYAIIYKVSGANLNPLVTAGMMATRRMSAIRGILYMIAQVLGALLGFVILNAFRVNSGAEITPEMAALIEANGEQFWAVALIELIGAIVIAFCFARSLRCARRSPLTFAYVVASAIVFMNLIAIVLSQNYFGFYDNLVFNPASALVYGIFPTAAEGFGEAAGLTALALSAYVLVPIVGGILGFYLSDIVSRLAGRGFAIADTECCLDGKCCEK